jgi:hypothetical protein
MPCAPAGALGTRFISNASGKKGFSVQITNVLRTYYRVLIATLILALLICLIFRSGPILTCILGFFIAVTLFWLRECHQKIYGLIEIVFGLFILYEAFPKGRGGFSADFSDDFQKFQSSVVLISTVGAVYPVFYDDAVTKRRHKRPINEAVSIFQLAANYAHRHLKDHRIGFPFLRELALQVIASPLIWNCLTCKNTGYKVEDEVRLVALGQKAKFRKYLRTRFRNGKRVPYIESHMPLQKRGSIVEIIIGPAAPKNAERYIKTVLKDAGIKFAIPIRRSKIPYRSFKSRSP